MFETRTYENLLEEMLAMAPSDTDTRVGSVFYRHVAPVAFMLARYYTELEITINMISIDTAEGDYLDWKAEEHNVFRIDAICCQRIPEYVGTISVGDRFFAGDIYWVAVQVEDAGILVEAEEGGESANTLSSDLSLVPLVNTGALESAKLGTIYTNGAETETDDNLRRRLQEKVAESAENGNTQHYKTWCESIEGVGIARISPLWDGANTVLGILVGTDGQAATEALVEEVQEYIDPNSEGLGMGVANIGAYFTAQAAEEKEINISVDLQLTDSAVLATVQSEIEASIADYFQGLALGNGELADVTVRISAISNCIYDCEGVLDYQDFFINDGTANIVIPYTHVPVLGVLTIGEV